VDAVLGGLALGHPLEVQAGAMPIRVVGRRCVVPLLLRNAFVAQPLWPGRVARWRVLELVARSRQNLASASGLAQSKVTWIGMLTCGPYRRPGDPVFRVARYSPILRPSRLSRNHPHMPLRA
jgi:hypothetical protein